MMHRMWVALVVAAVVGVLSVVACAASRARDEVELVFQQNVNGYAGCKALNARGELCQGERANLQNVTFVFADLRLSGNEVKVNNAELRMHFLEIAQLLAMLRAKDPALARTLGHKMVQETKDYDRSFAAPVQQTTRNWDKGGKGEPVTGFIVWESNTKRLAETRAAIAKAIAEAK